PATWAMSANGCQKRLAVLTARASPTARRSGDQRDDQDGDDIGDLDHPADHLIGGRSGTLEP
ncbi:MAG: hypothetical protein ACKOTH_04650, partial [Solirubrobacterales bacterium]